MEKGAILPESALAFSLIVVVCILAGFVLFQTIKAREQKTRETFRATEMCPDPELCP